jgi:hypothetical protein
MMRQAAILLEEMILMKCFRKLNPQKKPLLKITEAFYFYYFIIKQSPSSY